MSEIDVIGVGNAIVDILAKTDDATLARLNLPKGHMQLISSEEADRLYAEMGPAREVSGGSAANSCAGVAAFGGSCRFIGTVQDDQFGKIFAHDLNAAGVQYNTAVAAGDTPTARCLVLVTPDGERTMSTYLGASVELGPEDIDDEQIKLAKITYLEGYLFDPPRAKEAFFKAAAIAKANGGKVALSLSDAFCVERHRDDFHDFIKSSVDILFANEEEIQSLYQTADFSSAAEKVRHYVDVAALTQGANGSIIIEPEATAAAPAFPVDEVIDTTGAGDLYAAGFLYGLIRGTSMETCGKLGALAASEIISHMGARPEADLVALAKAEKLL